MEITPKIVLPNAPNSIQKGVPLKLILDRPAINQMGMNLKIAYGAFDAQGFINKSLLDIEPLALKERGIHIAQILKDYLPSPYSKAIEIILSSLTPPLKETTNLGLSGMFYLPHVCFVEIYGQEENYNDEEDPFDISMKAQYELTKRFSAEFSIRTFIKRQSDRTFSVLYEWMKDPDPHIRRLCSEGTRPRLPWASKIQSLILDPRPSLPILNLLKDDEDLYVRRSVANHVGDIAKDNLDLALELCSNWLKDSSKERKWVIRHALRYPSKKGIKTALSIRKAAK